MELRRSYVGRVILIQKARKKNFLYEFNVVSKHEECLWKQKSGCNRIKNGDISGLGGRLFENSGATSGG